MPKSRATPSASIADQLRSLALEVRQATAAHAAMDVSMKKMQALNQKLMLAVSRRGASVLALLDKADATSAQKDEFAKLRAIERACEAQLLLLQLQMQRENQVFTSVSNVLKTRHDTVKNSIVNIK